MAYEKKCENMSDKIIVISSNFKKFLEKESLKKKLPAAQNQKRIGQDFKKRLVGDLRKS